ncbi:molybdenum cofactor guanylyltransferase [Sphingomonas sp. RS6]
MKLLGAILAGGMASRFGSDKALAQLGGRTLIEHVEHALRRHCDAIVICGRQQANGIADRPRMGLGPMGGINAAIAEAAARDFDSVLTAPCDTPILPAELLSRLIAAKGPAILAEVPVIGLWPASLGAACDHFLDNAERLSVRHWARQVGAAEIAPGVTVPNINSLEDLHASAGFFP